MEIRELGPGRDAATARSLWRMQRAAYAVEAALIGDDRIPPLRETLDELRAAPLHWLGALTTGPGHAGDVPARPLLDTSAMPAQPLAASARLLGAVAWQEDAESVEIDRLVVDPAAHRQGVGRALVGAVLNRAGDRPVTVATGRANRPARALYESSGFVVVGEAQPVPGLWVTRYVRASAAATRSA